jgi:hypothetical protein
VADDILRIDLGDRGGLHSFKSRDEVSTWVSSELETWQWMAASEGQDNFGLWNYISHRLTWLRDQLTSAVNSGNQISNLGHLFHPVFLADSEFVLHSEGDQGRRVLDIHEAEGPLPARAAYAVAARRTTLQQISALPQLRGVMLLAAPNMIPAEAIAKRLSNERRNLRDRTDRLIEKLEAEAAARRDEHEGDRERNRRVAIRWARRRFGRWRQALKQHNEVAKAAQAEFLAQRNQTAEDFSTLRATYEETMRLKAPAKYWSDKADRHKKAEGSARNRLLLYFPVAIAGIALLFWFAADQLLKRPPENGATALYFIVSAGLATLAGVTFWIGRLLTKLYLSEHHLRVDAEEREIMTTTYLALTKDKAAEEADRQIILAALFRSTPDGIVREDGPADVGLAMLLSRLGIPGKP